MNDSFIGELRPVGFGFAPKGWLLCQGQLLPVLQNQALFSLLGTTYGGNGQTTFALPDLRGRLPVGVGALSGNPSSNYVLGQMGGVESISLTTGQMPAHTHPITGTMKTAGLGDPSNPQNNFLANDTNAQFSASPPTAAMGGGAQGTSSNIGGNQPHDNRQPVIGINYAICLQGYFPSRG